LDLANLNWQVSGILTAADVDHRPFWINSEVVRWLIS
jgi:hypothetical protein